MARAEHERGRVVRGTNTSTEITPAAVRQYPWTLDYQSPDYAYDVRDPETRDDPAACAALGRRGFQISLSQACMPDNRPDIPRGVMRALPNAVYLSAWIASDRRAAKFDDDAVIDGGIVDLDDLEAFAAVLVEMARSARRERARQQRRGSAGQ